MIETILIEIYLSPRQHIGFTVKAKHDGIMQSHKQELQETLDRLANALRNNEYPFRLLEGRFEELVLPEWDTNNFTQKET